MNKVTQRLTAGLVFALAASACSAGGSENTPGSGDSTSDIGATNGELTLGARGESVRAVNEYLTRFGYFPNQELSKAYPAWRPVVERASQDAGVYDEQTEQAVRALQQNSGLEVTGRVDEATKALIVKPRCGVPDGIAHLDSHDKFALQGSRWPGNSTSRTQVSWKIANNDQDIALADTRAAASAAFATWSVQTFITFTEVTGSAPADIEISFAPIDGPGGSPGMTNPPSQGGDVTLDQDEAWSLRVPLVFATCNPTCCIRSGTRWVWITPGSRLAGTG